MASKKFAKAQEEAKKYVDQHNLERFVTQMMNGMIQAKPADPRIYMIRFIAERCSVQMMEANGICVEGLPPDSPGGGGGGKQRSRGKSGRIGGGGDIEATASPEPREAAEPAGQELGGASLAPEPPAAGLADIQPDTESPAAPGVGRGETPEQPQEQVQQRPGPSDSDTAKWTSIEEWEQLVRHLEDGGSLPPPGTTATVGGPKWLAEMMVGQDETQTLGRLTWLSECHGSYLFQVDSDGTDLAMALTAETGEEGKWNEWLFDRGICIASATDSAGDTLKDHARRGSLRSKRRASGDSCSGGAGTGSAILGRASISTQQVIEVLSTWEGLVADLESGGGTMRAAGKKRALAAPSPDTLGSPVWLARLLGSGGPGAACERLELMGVLQTSSLYEVDSEGTNLAMALAGELGQGAWLDWLFDRGICMKGATDNTGKTAADCCASAS